MPPFVRQHRQFNDEQNKSCYKVARLRIHVERCIARLKTFGIMRSINHHLYPYMDKLLVILASVINNMPDLISEDENHEPEEQDNHEPEEQDNHLNDMDDKIDEIVNFMSAVDVRNEGLDE